MPAPPIGDRDRARRNGRRPGTGSKDSIANLLDNAVRYEGDKAIVSIASADPMIWTRSSASSSPSSHWTFAAVQTHDRRMSGSPVSPMSMPLMSFETE